MIFMEGYFKMLSKSLNQWNYSWTTSLIIKYSLPTIVQVQNLSLNVKGLDHSRTLNSHITPTHHHHTFLPVPGYTSSWKSVHNLSVRGRKCCDEKKKKNCIHKYYQSPISQYYKKVWIWRLLPPSPLDKIHSFIFLMMTSLMTSYFDNFLSMSAN